MADVLAVFSWWLVISLLGVVGLPIAWRLFAKLPDRGYVFARPLGLLALSYLVWLGASAGFLTNTLSAIVGVLLALAAISGSLARADWPELRQWLRSQRRQIILVEVLFLATFAFWAFVRAHSPDIVGTEKPMELAFLNATLESTHFPPKDPWLAGYAISYYYFGFVMLSLLTKLTGVASGVAFNLASALWFSLTILGCYSIVYNLLKREKAPSGLGVPLLGPLLVVITGNLVGFLEVLHARHVFWRRAESGEWTSRFWQWLDVKDLVQPPAVDPRWIPERHWWWWRASRVVRDVTLDGVDLEVIDEFPFFSFLLADNHPHVLALPFVLMAIAFALQVFLGGERQGSRLSDLWNRLDVLRWLPHVAGALVLVLGLARFARQLGQGAGASQAIASGVRLTMVGGLAAAGAVVLILVLVGRLRSLLEPWEFLAAAWLYGSLAFLNTWDFPIYLSLFIGVLWWASRGDESGRRLGPLLSTSLAVVAAGILLYLPWYPTFSSQAGGILPNLAFPTKAQHFVLMFAPAFIPLAVWLGLQVKGILGPGDGWKLAGLGLAIPIALLLVSWALGGVIATYLRSTAELPDALAALGAESSGQAVQAVIDRRLSHSLTSVILGFAAAASFMILLRARRAPASGSKRGRRQEWPVWPFVALMAGLGGLLVLGPEYMYLKDFFSTRMNTVFKFYFAGWILWGLAAAYAIPAIWPRLRGLAAWLKPVALLPLLLGLTYPLAATWTRAQGFQASTGRTLDGTAYLNTVYQDDASAIHWLNQNADSGVVAEAVVPPPGCSYVYYGRIATHTGLPTVLGWPCHENQWRGTMEPQGSRREDIDRLYRTRDWREAKQLVEKYDIKYVLVGPLERSTYGSVPVEKFAAFMQPVYRNGDAVIFATPDSLKAD